jgi:hypothetical protein
MGTIQPAIGLDGGANHRFDCGGLGDIDLYEGRLTTVFCDHMGSLLSPGVVQVSDYEFGAFSGKGERCRSANT